MSTKKLSLEDYEKLKVFMGKFADWHWIKPDMPPEIHPLQFLENLEKSSLANAKKGLQQTVNDIVEITADWRPDQVAAADAKFAAAGTFTLSQVRSRYSKKYLPILKRGVIRSETEYYLLKGVVDGGSIEPGATESQQMEAMLHDYEERIAPK